MALTRSASIRAALVGATLTAATVLVGHLQLPFDEEYNAVLYLMWSTTSGAQPAIGILFALILTLCVSTTLILAWSGLERRTPSPPIPDSLVYFAKRYAVRLPLLAFLAMHLGRLTANLLYALVPAARADLSPYLAALEAPSIAHLQSVFAGQVYGWVAAILYSVVWAVLVLGFGPLLVVLNRRSAVDQVIVATPSMALLAIPLFLALPVFDPWSMNPAYGYAATTPVEVRYLYPNVDPARLADIATRLRWATGACLPSLHVGFPLLYAIIAVRERLTTLAGVYGAFAAITAVVVVYLGRHWAIDAVATIPFVWVVGAATARVVGALDRRAGPPA